MNNLTFQVYKACPKKELKVGYDLRHKAFNSEMMEEIRKLGSFLVKRLDLEYQERTKKKLLVRVSDQKAGKKTARGSFIDKDHFVLVPIKVENCRTFRQIGSTLCHEFIHVHQSFQGRLIKEDGAYHWRGGFVESAESLFPKEVLTPKFLEYVRRPYESEAFRNQSTLLNQYIEQNPDTAFNRHITLCYDKGLK